MGFKPEEAAQMQARLAAGRNRRTVKLTWPVFKETGEQAGTIAANIPVLLRGKKPREIETSEHEEQSAVIKWAEWQKCQFPGLELLFAIPNGGQRHPAVATKLKAEGVRAGVSDLMLPVARGGHHGLWIEMKSSRGKVSPTQSEWIDAMKAQGYATAVCFNADAAIAVLAEYLQKEPTFTMTRGPHSRGGAEKE